MPPFDAGTNAVAAKAAELTRAGRLFSVAGGGDTLAALAYAGVAEEISYLSTAGGAFLEWLQGKTLPGVAALAIGCAQAFAILPGISRSGSTAAALTVLYSVTTTGTSGTDFKP